MAVNCGPGLMMYVLPMLLGRTFDQNHDVVGIDIYDKKDIDSALKNPIFNPSTDSKYLQIESSSEKRDFLGISGDLALKISSGLVEIKGAGDYLKATSKTSNKLEILVKTTFKKMWVKMSPDATPLTYWQMLDRQTVGTDVVTSILYGGEVYASINFVALKSEYMQEIKAQVQASISKTAAFDGKAQGELDMLARNLSSKAKLEIDYYGTVPLEGVPTTIEGLSKLVNSFEDQVNKVNNGNGVAICAEFTELSTWDDKFKFDKNLELQDSLEDFNDNFNDLRQAKGLLKGLIESLPNLVTQDYLKKIIEFSGRLTEALSVFHESIGNLDLEKDSGQLSKARDAYAKNTNIPNFGDKYTIEVNKLIKELDEKVDPTVPRGMYVEWGSKTCTNKGANPLYIGFMTSFMEVNIGSGSEYQCLPENPDLTLPPDSNPLNQGTSKLGGVRYKNMSVFQGNGKRIEDKVATCVVCETLMRPTIQMFPGLPICPGDWVSEYSGYMVSSVNSKNRAQYICVTKDPDVYDSQTRVDHEPVILPAKISGKDLSGNGYKDGASVPCSVCSK